MPGTSLAHVLVGGLNVPTSGTLSNANVQPRTVVLHRPTARVVGDRITEIWSRLPPRLRSIGVWLAQPNVLAVPAVLATAFTIVLVYYYNKFASEIDVGHSGSS
jgi:hypothetical protein